MGKWWHPRPVWLGHLFYRRYPRSIRLAVFRRRPPAPQTPNSPLSPPLESIHCCSCSYYRCAPAKCKTSVSHLSAHSSMKTSFMPFPSQPPLPHPLSPDMMPELYQANLGLVKGWSVWLTETFLEHFNSEFNEPGKTQLSPAVIKLHIFVCCIFVSIFANLKGKTFEKQRHAWSHINLATAAKREGRVKNVDSAH